MMNIVFPFFLRVKPYTVIEIKKYNPLYINLKLTAKEIL